MREQYESPKAEVIEYEIEENILDLSTNKGAEDYDPTEWGNV